LNTIGDHPAEAQKIRKAWEIDRFSGYPWLSPIKNWKIMENRKRKNPPKTMGISFVNNFFLSIFPLKPLENHGTSIFSQPNQSKKRHFAVQSRRLIRRFLAMLMQPVRLQLLESDGMMG
jgi:hypothetical protein